MEKHRIELELEITDLSRSGSGVSRDATGRVIFVHGTAPGDRVIARLSKVDKRYAEAELVEVLKPSELRTAPRCRYFGKCGGCQWQHLPYELQWKTKVSGALHALKRVGISSLESIRVEEFPAENPWNYRNRIQLRGGEFGLGFYSRGSHDVVAIDRCEIAREELNAALTGYRAEAQAKKTPSKLELDVSPEGQVRAAWNSGHAALGFRQVHDAQNDSLKRWIAGWLKGGAVLFDLYGGSGNLSLGIASRFSRVECVDLGAGRGFVGKRPEHFQFHSSDVGKWVEKRLKTPVRAEKSGGACILDPPREGCGAALSSIATLLEDSGVTEVIAVGCDPDSWARDVSRVVGRQRSGQWSVESLAFFDFFPQTVHLESVARLVRVDTLWRGSYTVKICHGCKAEPVG